MNRRGFLNAIFKAGVSAAILPPAVTYVREWVKAKDSEFIIPIIYKRPAFSANDIELYNKLPFYLARMEINNVHLQWDTWLKLGDKQKWKPNLGDSFL